MGLSEEDYHAYPCWSYSLLSRFDSEGPSSLSAEEKAVTPSMAFGNLVDCLVTRGKDMFDKLYYVLPEDMTVPPAIRQVIDELVRNDDSPFMATVSDDKVLSAANMFCYQTNWKDATRIAKIRELGSSYYKFAASNRGKAAITVADATDASAAAEALKADPDMSRFMGIMPLGNNEAVWQLQLKAFDTAVGAEYKGMLDLVSIDHTTKTVHPIDIKTTKDVYLFEDSFYQWRYYLQASMYTSLLREAIGKSDIAGYGIGLYRFFVIDRNNLKPTTFIWHTTDIVYDKYGIKRASWRELMARADWMKRHGIPKEWSESYADHGGVLLRNYSDEQQR